MTTELTTNSSLPFVQDATKSLQSMMEYANLILESEMAPKHFYEMESYTDGYGKNKTRIKRNPQTNLPIGKPGAVILAIQNGHELGLSITQSLQLLVPMDGSMTLKGDGAKALILSSGKCAEWKETESGSIDDETYAITIYAKRKDNGMEKTTTFSIKDAKRMGLWVSEADLKTRPALKYSAWYKTPTRMIAYRAIGFISRDVFGDVVKGLQTAEEVYDLKETREVRDVDPVIEGMTVKDETVAKSKTLADEALKSIKKPGKKITTEPQAEDKGIVDVDWEEQPNQTEQAESAEEIPETVAEEQAVAEAPKPIPLRRETARTVSEVNALRVKLENLGYVKFASDIHPILVANGIDDQFTDGKDFLDFVVDDIINQLPNRKEE